VYEVDPLTCSRCGSPMRILAVITETEEVRKILRHLVKIGRSPPGLDQSFVELAICLPACSGESLCPPRPHGLPPRGAFLGRLFSAGRSKSRARGFRSHSKVDGAQWPRSLRILGHSQPKAYFNFCDHFSTSGIFDGHSAGARRP
jgi:hypothetical protein